MEDSLAYRVTSEARSVRRLAKSLDAYLEKNLAFRRYPPELTPLFDFFSGALRAVREYGTSTLKGLDQQSDMYARNLLKTLYTTKRIVQLLYEKLHAAIQAETLNTPFPILRYLNALVGQLKGAIGDGVTVGFLAAQPMMYYHYPMEETVNLSAQLQLTISGFPAFPKGLALIGYPYTESTNTLLNCALIHELGHYVWDKLPISRKVAKLAAGLSITGLQFKTLFDERYYAAACKNALRRWGAEAFSDAFALMYIGPAYSFAFREMANMLPVPERAEDTFSQTHPAISYRWHIHAAMLKKIGWWEILREEAEAEHSWLSGYLAERKYAAPFAAIPGLPDRVLRIFDKIVRAIIEYCTGEFSESAKTVCEEFRKIGGDVKKYLEHGIPPASVVIGGESTFPLPATIVNAGWFLSLEGMTETLRLMGREGDELAHDVLESRLAGWVSKAMEDVPIVVMQEGGGE
ncbi:MAG: hypothetical protein R6X20_04615 [Phycisphaerae bacterium]